MNQPCMLSILFIDTHTQDIHVHVHVSWPKLWVCIAMGYHVTCDNVCMWMLHVHVHVECLTRTVYSVCVWNV